MAPLSERAARKAGGFCSLIASDKSPIYKKYLEQYQQIFGFR